jgi:hypothetical protein
MSDDEPRKGKEWLALKLREGASRLWHEPTRTGFGFRSFAEARVIDSRNPQPARPELAQMADEAEALRKSLRSSDAIAMLSIRVVARDWRKRGRTVETWLKCSLIRRLIERPKPTREGIGHDRYSILIAYLVAAGLAEPDSRNGYQWTQDYKTLRARAEWLAQLTHREGDLRNLRSAHRYSITFE